MNARIASFIVLAELAFQVIYYLVAKSSGLISSPELGHPAYLIPAGICALLGISFGVYAKKTGDKELPLILQLTNLFAIISGICFFVYAGLFAVGIDLFPNRPGVD